LSARVVFVLACALSLLPLAGCDAYKPGVVDESAYLRQSQSQTRGGVTVMVAVPTAAQSAEVFGVPLAKHDIQPIWLRVENREDLNYVYLPASTDPDYFSPQEAAWKGRFGYSSQGQLDMQARFHELRMPLSVPAGRTVQGFVHINSDRGVKYVSVVLFHPGHTKQFEFVFEAPGIRTDYSQVDFDNVIAPDQRREVDLQGLRDALQAYPCCVLGPDGKTPGDPLNIVVIGPRGGKVFHPLVRRGWDVTETISGSSVFNTVWSSLFGTSYRTSPVSPLFLDGRRQDIALQKARGSVDERNHLRLWLTPLSYQGQDVWIGQISRDIGIRPSSKTIVTHKIDPHVDETREFFVQDLLLSGGLQGMAYVTGVGEATPRQPRRNYTLDPYFTDGLRVVLFVSDSFVQPDRIAFIDWEWPRE
jgi:hypothetical protein